MKEEIASTDSSKTIVPLLPLRDVVLFPYMVVPLFVGREKSISALEEALSKKKDVFLCAQRKTSFFLLKASSNALIDFSLPTKSGTTMYGNKTTSLKGKRGTIVFELSVEAISSFI